MLATVTKISKSMTEADRAYRILQNSILMGELKPGEKITRRQMAEIAGTSVIPVTEALQRLESSGLVTREPNGRTSVALPTLEEMVGKYMLREAIECKVVQILCENGLGEEQQKRLYDLAELIDPGSPLSQGELVGGKPHLYYHRKWHDMLAAATGFSCFAEVFDSSSLNFMVMQLNYAHQSKEPYQEGSVHREILDLIVQRKSAEAQEKMRKHIYVAYDYVMRNLAFMRQQSGRR